MDNIGYGRERLKDIAEKEAEEETKEQQQDDHEQYDTVSKIKFLHEVKRVKELGLTGN